MLSDFLDEETGYRIGSTRLCIWRFQSQYEIVANLRVSFKAIVSYTDQMAFHHVPVLLEESVAAWRGLGAASLRTHPRARFFIDCTVGGAGHTARLLQLEENARVLGLDRDPAAVTAATARLHDLGFAPRATVALASYSALPVILSTVAADFPIRVDGIFADLGVSSPQLDDGARGFSLQRDGPLDMRFGADAPASAADLVNTLPEKQLAMLFSDLGEEPCAAAAARAIVARRGERPFEMTLDLAGVIGSSVRSAQRARFRSVTTSLAHPATRCFQALRMAVNGELAALQRLLAIAPTLLAPGGRFAVLSFHSLEDRLVKRAFAALCGGSAAQEGAGISCAGTGTQAGRLSTSFKRNFLTGTFSPVVFGSGTVGRRFAVASDEEIEHNPRSRTAKLRAVECKDSDFFE